MRRGQLGSGPFYCPADQRVYIDLDFLRRAGALALQSAPGDFAQAYVVAHEVGHHVQHLIGIADKVRGAQQRASQEEQNALQVRMELQADCFAGIWAQSCAALAPDLLESGDVEEALGAAAAVGDDMIQKRTQGHVVPESFTHGTRGAAPAVVRAGTSSRGRSAPATPSRRARCSAAD